MKKFLLALCILLLAFPSWAASRVIQGDAQFVYSQEIDEAVNPKIGEEQEFVGFDPEGEPIYTTIPIYKYTSITSPTVTLGNVATIFPLNLDGMVFNVSYSSVSGKPGIYPGVFTFQFSKSEILMLPNGAVIMDEIENSTSPVDVLFKYFDPVFVIYGTDGEKVSINVKNFPLNFSFVTGSYENMAISFPVVLADGYPDTFCIEQINGYLFVYDAMVSQENAGVISDGKIEVAFALVPNERATNVARQDFPVLKLNGEKGYVIFDDPSEYLGIPEMTGVQAVVPSSNVVFEDTERGFSFTVDTAQSKNAVLVTCAVHSQQLGSLVVNGNPVNTGEILLPDGTRYLTAQFVLVNGSFSTDAFVSGDVVYVFDGAVDDIFTASLDIDLAEVPGTPSVGPVLSSSNLLLKPFEMDDATLSLIGLEKAEADFEYLGLTDPPDKEGVLKFVSVGSFEGTYDGTGKCAPLMMEVSVSSYDLERLSKDRHAKIISKWSEDRSVFLDYFHVYKQVGDLIYDLVMMGGKSAFTVSGDPTTRVTISFPAVLIDDVGNTYYDEVMGFVIYDGNPDGKLVDPLFVGTPEQIPVEEGEEEPKDEEEPKHILPDNPTGSSMGNDDLKDWIKVFSLF